MAAGGTAKELELDDEDFTITKEISTDGEHIQVDLDVTTNYDEVVTVSIEEQLPEETTASQVGFLPNKAPHDSQITDEETFHLDIRAIPQRAQRVVYGLKDITNEEAAALSTEPRILEVRSPNGEVIDDRADNPAVKTDDAAEETPETQKADEAESAAAVTEAEPPTAEADTESGDYPASSGATADGRGVQAELDQEAVEALAEEIESRIELDAITETKLSQLQEDVADVRAYLPALEEFLGEAGRADEIVEELEAMREQAQELQEMPEELDERIGAVDEQIEQLQTTADELETQLETVNERIDELEDWRTDLASVTSQDSE